MGVWPWPRPDLSDGGLAVAAAECCMASGLGAHLELPAGDGRLDHLWFAEGGARILVSVPPVQTMAWQQALDQARSAGHDVPAQCLGVVAAGADFSISQAGTPLLEVPIDQLHTTFEQAIPRRMGADLPPTNENSSWTANGPVVVERPDKPEEACGVYAVLAAGQPVANLTYFGLYALQHRGQESAGIAVFDAENKV
eukprot:gene8964-11993_t